MHRYLFFNLHLLKIAQIYTLSRGERCTINEDCQSQNCALVCNELESVCIQPSWFFLRHGLEAPNCVKRNIINTKLFLYKKRIAGETCHTDKNCYSNKCIPPCGSNESMWKCIESTSYYEKKKIKPPTCFEEKNNRADNVKDNKDDKPLRQFGEACLNDLNCVSRNCSPICNATETESLCNAPRRLLKANNSSLPLCIDKNALAELTVAYKENSNVNSKEVRGFVKRHKGVKSNVSTKEFPFSLVPIAYCFDFIHTIMIKYIL